MTKQNSKYNGLEIAVIGISARFPGAVNTIEFWENLKNGVESITFLTKGEVENLDIDPKVKNDSQYVNCKGGIMDGKDLFDPDFFGYAPNEAQALNPQSRILHESTWHALEDAGYNPEDYKGSIGLYAGSSSDFEWKVISMLNERELGLDTFFASLFNERDYLTTRVSYNLNLKGPSVLVQSTCSTSLVAIHLACRALLTGECDMAVAGGVNLNILESKGYVYKEGMVLSKDGHCRAFDKNASGIAVGEGVGLVVLKKLNHAIKDRDNIYAIIKGSSVNNDGNQKVGYTAPSVKGQKSVIEAALKMAEVPSESVGYIEAHGTGTKLGDPVEIEALKKAFNSSKKSFCGIGSLKANVGHMGTASGVGSFIKGILSLKHRMIPPSINFEEPNPSLGIEDSPFYINRNLKEWTNNEYPLRAGVSSFGIGGTNAHVIIEEAPELKYSKQEKEYKLLLVSANNEESLKENIKKLTEFLQNNCDINLSDISYTLSVGRKEFDHRAYLICSDIDDALGKLNKVEEKGFIKKICQNSNSPIVFMFSGQGSQYINMGLGLYKTEPEFRNVMDNCFKILSTISDYNYKEIIYPSTEEFLNETVIDNIDVSPVITFVIEYSLAKLLMDWDIKPSALIGHSIGEYTAACLSGVLTLEDALDLVSYRGYLMTKLPEGVMLNIPLESSKLSEYLNDQISLAADHGESCIISGSVDSISFVEKLLKENRIICQRLKINVAGHSRDMEMIMNEYKQKLQTKVLSTPQIPYISNVTGEWITIEDAGSVDYWVMQLRKTVQFSKGLEELSKLEDPVFCEIGPGNSLSTITYQFIKNVPNKKIFNTIRLENQEYSDVFYLVSRIGYLWLNGIKINWQKYYHGEERRRISLPGYSFSKKKFEINESLAENILQKRDISELVQVNDNIKERLGIDNWTYFPIWKPTILNYTDSGEVNSDKVCLVFANNEKICSRLIDRFNKIYESTIIVKEGNKFNINKNNEAEIRPGNEKDLNKLIEYLKNKNTIPEMVVHLWNLSNEKHNLKEIEKVKRSQNLGFYSLLFLAKAYANNSITNKVELCVVTDQMQSISGSQIQYPEKATLLGAIRTIPLELSNFRCKSVDIAQNIEGEKEELQLINSILDEILINTKDRIISYQNNHRFALNYERVNINTGKDKELYLKKNGAYLITGALGGLGLEIAEYLAKNVSANLILVSRSKFPDESEWDKLLNKPNSDQIVEKINKLKFIKSFGHDTIICNSDISNYNSVNNIVRNGIKKFGRIDGIIHCAGLPGGGLIQLKTTQKVEEVFTTKLYGTLVINRIIEELKLDLDFVLLFSSLNAIYPNVGTIDYTAANAFLDAFAYYKNTQNTKYISINWDAWQEVGGAVKTLKQLSNPFNENSFIKRKIDHFLFRKYISNENESILISYIHSENDWIVNEHRILDKATMPGTGYLQMLYAAVQFLYPKNDSVEIRALHILRAMVFEKDENKEIHTIITQKGDLLDFKILSYYEDEDSWIEHCKGQVSILEAKLNIQENIDYFKNQELKPTKALENNLHENEYLRFGKRWRNNNVKIKVGENIGLSDIIIGEESLEDLKEYSLHPGLVDVALSPILSKGAFLPAYYHKITIIKPLTKNFCSLVRLNKSENEDFINYDFVLSDDSGTILKVEGYNLLDISNSEIKSTDSGELSNYTSSDFINYVSPEKIIKEESEKVNYYLKDAIKPSEGKIIFSRALACNLNQIIVSTIDLEQRKIDDNKELESKLINSSSSVKNLNLRTRPELSTNYVAPNNDIEEQLVKIWEDHLTFEGIGVFDDFFELGGNSVKAILIINSIREKLNFNIKIADFFKNKNVKKLTDYLNRSSIADSTNSINILPSEKKEYYTISSAQKRLFILDSLTNRTISFNLPHCYRIKGEFYTERLQCSIELLIKRYESLRTSFKIIKGDAVQIVHDPEEILFDKLNVTKIDNNELEDIFENSILPFDLSKAPLFRIKVFKISDDDHLLFIDIHHIIADAYSCRLFINQLFDTYQSNSTSFKPINIQYKEFGIWQENRNKLEEFESQKKYWLNLLNGNLPILNLPVDFSRPVLQSTNSDLIVVELDSVLTTKIKEFCTNIGVTSYVYFLSVYYILLYKYTNQKDIIIGSTIFGRSSKDFEELIGIFINILPIRIQIDIKQTLLDFFNLIKDKTIEAMSNQDYQFDDLVNDLKIERDTSHNPVFEAGFSYLGFDESSELKNLSDNLDIKPVKIFNKEAAKNDITIYCNESDTIEISVEYCSDIFRKDFINQFTNHFRNLLITLIDNSSVRLYDIECNLPDEKSKLIERFNETTYEYPQTRSIHELFEDRSDDTPDHVAISYGKSLLTYKELSIRSNQMANYLRDQGVLPGQTIGLLSGRSLELIIGIFGILKSGCSYLPLDPSYPELRIKNIIESSGIDYLLSDNSLNKVLTDNLTVLDINYPLIHTYPGLLSFPDTTTPTDLAYIIYTTGSTGTPKGVMIEHKSLVNFVYGINKEIPFSTTDCLFSLTTISFDIFGLELFVPLLRGSRLVLGNEQEQLDGDLILRRLEEFGVTILQLTPSRLQLLLGSDRVGRSLRNLKSLLLGGEELSLQLLENVRQLTNAEIFNMYGPTETTIWSSIKNVTREKEISIGKPIVNTQLYVLDESNGLVPQGCIGELCIGGDGLARGYFQDEALSSEKFIEHPFESTGKLYKTGDLARWLPDGNLMFLGRTDYQVKIRGFRIELREIERVILGHENISECVVLCREEEGDKYLCAYYVPGSKIDQSELRNYLGGILPDYMVPGYFEELTSLPLTSNGKIDRKSLPKPEIRSGKDYVAPRSTTELQLVKIWSEILQIEEKEISINDSFFDLGGHSLKATILISRIFEEFNVKLTLSDVFINQDISKLSAVVNSSKKLEYETIKSSEKKDYYELSAAQRRLFLLYQLNKNSTSYNLPGIYSFEDELDKDLIKDIFLKLINRHESLRTSFSYYNDKLIQKITDDVNFDIEYIDLRNLNNQDFKKSSNLNQVIKNFIQPFDLNDPPLLRACIAQTESKSYLLFDLHHIISDAISNDILIEDFLSLYNKKELFPLKLQYKDYAEWANSQHNLNLDKQLNYWLNKFKDPFEILKLPVNRIKLEEPESENYLFSIDKNLHKKIREYTKGNNTTLYAFLLSVYNILLFKYTNQENFFIGTPVAGRIDNNLNNIVGFFINMLPVKSYIDTDLEYETYLNKIKNETIVDFENQDLPYDELIFHLRKSGKLSEFDLINTVFTMQYIDEGTNQINNTINAQREKNLHNKNLKYLLTLDAFGSSSRTNMLFRYASDSFNQDFISQMADHFQRIIELVINNNSIILSQINLTNNYILANSELIENHEEEFNF